MKLARQLAQLRQKRRIGLAAISELVGMAVPNLSTALRGRTDSRASTLEAIASALDAEWVLVPKEHLHEVQQILQGKGTGPDRTAPSAVDAFLGGERE